MNVRWLAFCLVLAVYAPHTFAESHDTGQWIVVTAPDFVGALAPLVDHRRAEGFDVVVVRTTDVLSAEQIARGQALPLRDHLRDLCRRASGESFILLVGVPSAADPVARGRTVVPPLEGTIGRMKGRPSDNGYGCLNDDLMPTVAVGRFPARSVDEAESMVRKTLEMERDRPFDSWQSRLVMIVGNPGGASWIEKRFAEWFVQMAGQSRLTQLHPCWGVRAIVQSPSSPFNVPGDQLHDVAVHHIEEGEMFSFYLGHSSAYGLGSDGRTFLTRDDFARLTIPQGRGVFFTCGCYACQFQGFGGEGYGLAAIRNSGGPAAVMGAYGESYAAMGQLAVDGMLEYLSMSPSPTRLATFWLAAKAGLAKGQISSLMFQMYDQADGSGGKTPLEVQRQEHLEMWTLLGDPALRLPMQPLNMQLEVQGDAVRPGRPINLKGTLPDRFGQANIHITVESPIGSANDVVILGEEIVAQDRNFECEMELPLDIPWSTVVIRAHGVAGARVARGVLAVPVSDEDD